MDTPTILTKILDQSGQTQDELARVFEVSRQTVSSWLNASSEPHPQKQMQIHEYYLEIVGTDDTDTEVLDTRIAEASQTSLTIKELLSSTALLDKMLILMTYHTNSIEGSTMTLADNKKVLLEDKVLTNRTSREQLEARNHHTTLLWLLDQINDGTIAWDEQLALDVHIRLMNGLVSDAGSYRNHGVRIFGTRVTVANYLKIPELMNDLFRRSRPRSYVEFARFHADFERIHPFSDGNGRVGRLLLYALAIMHDFVPPIIERQRRAAYYRALETVQMHDNIRPLTYLVASESITAKDNLNL